MPGKITRKFRLQNTKQFVEQFSEASPSRVYFFIARNVTWSDENNPPAPVGSVEEIENDVWTNMIGLKKINASDVSFALARYNWTSGTVYDQYVSNTEISVASDFFVLTDDYNVYKCMYNNNGAASTVKPTGKLESVIKTNDGYKWKYIYTVSTGEALKFITSNFIPVKTLTSDDGSTQWGVQQAAANGGIEIVQVNAGGSSYQFDSGTFASVTSNTVLSLATSASSTSDIYNGSVLYVSQGTGSGQIRTVTNYDGPSKTVTVSPAFSVSPTGSSQYVLSPKVNLTGDGTGFSAYCLGDSGAIQTVEVINPGLNYTRASVAFSANTGTGATAKAIISPRGGHGSNPVDEFYSHNAMMNVRLSGSESNKFMIDNDFRVIGLIVDPKQANGSIANNSVYDQTTRFTLTGPSGTFQKDELITGGTSGATANFIEYVSNTVVSVTGNLALFSSAETITGGTSAATATISSISLPELKKFTGDVVYLENRTPIVRASDQEEDIKFVIRF